MILGIIYTLVYLTVSCVGFLRNIANILDLHRHCCGRQGSRWDAYREGTWSGNTALSGSRWKNMEREHGIEWEQVEKHGAEHGIEWEQEEKHGAGTRHWVGPGGETWSGSTSWSGSKWRNVTRVHGIEWKQEEKHGAGTRHWVGAGGETWRGNTALSGSRWRNVARKRGIEWEQVEKFPK